MPGDRRRLPPAPGGCSGGKIREWEGGCSGKMLRKEMFWGRACSRGDAPVEPGDAPGVGGMLWGAVPPAPALLRSDTALRFRFPFPYEEGAAPAAGRPPGKGLGRGGTVSHTGVGPRRGRWRGWGSPDGADLAPGGSVPQRLRTTRHQVRLFLPDRGVSRDLQRRGTSALPRRAQDPRRWAGAAPHPRRRFSVRT